MKRLTRFTPVAAALALAAGTISAVSAEESTDKLSISGFVDMSYLSVDTDGAGNSHDSGIDQVEIDLAYDFGNKLSAYVDVEYQNSEVDVEQAFITYAVSDQFTLKAGRFLSYSGWETEEPTGLFQYSGTGYAKYFYGYYQQGVSGLYNGDGYALAVSVVNDLAGPESTDSEQPGIETMIALMPTDAITIKGFYSFDKLAGTEQDTKMFNLWASYSAGPLTLAAEVNSSEYTSLAAADASGYLVMANYAFDTFGLTLRYHDYEVEDAAGNTWEDMSAITISPSYAVNDNLLIVFEYRMDSDDVSGMDSDSIALEALLTF
ncbi:porin [Neptunicella sp. SCSIO 80796]|uniref:porin n=1 Tax=Neptunicella plasticusilytica TaxID=3117012 RepID=UPI003A4D5813